jgi:16S rRNA (uracil1498-N3)-methyltransferase
MAMSRRYYCSVPIDGDAVVLQGSEAHHLLHVLRARPGDSVVLFDGSGYECEARVFACKRNQVELGVESRRLVDRELPYSLTLGCPLPKGDRSRWIVEKSVELGVTRIVPLITRHAEPPPQGAKATEKLHRYVVEASKQCGRNRLASIEPPLHWQDWLQLPNQCADAANSVIRRVAHPDATPYVGLRSTHTCASAYVAVGPEGGLCDQEIVDAQAAGWDLVGLGPRILRIETAAIAMILAVAKSSNG